MKRPFVIALAAGATLLAAGAAHASDVRWSIGIGLPPIATVISNGPVYAPAPVYAPVPVYDYGPSPVYGYGPAPVYAPAPVVVAPPVYRAWERPRYVIGRPVVAYPRWNDGRWNDGRHDHRGDGRGHDEQRRRRM